jgi:ATP-dependent helicase/nuclease subunit B
MLRALWQPRLLEAIDWIASWSARTGERAPAAQGRGEGEAEIAGVKLTARPTASTGLPTALAIIDYKTGKPPSQKAVDAGFALQLGLLGLIAAPAGSRASRRPAAHEYWSLTKHNGQVRQADAARQEDRRRGVPRPMPSAVRDAAANG